MCVTIVDYNSNLRTGFHDWYTSSIALAFLVACHFVPDLYYLITRHSRSELARYLFYCMYVVFVCFLFGQRFLSNPRADSRQILRAGVALVGTCLLPFWGSAIGKLLSLGDGMQTFTEVIKLIRLCLSISVSSATAERS